MTDPLDQLAGWAGPLLARLTPAARKAAMREVSTMLRRRQVDRIKAQKNPDGTPYEARRPREQLKGKSGAIRRDMFARMRRPGILRMSAKDGEAVVFITAQASRTARVHQEGWRDKVDWRQANSPTVRYARRELLGFSSADVQAITDVLLRHIDPG